MTDSTQKAPAVGAADPAGQSPLDILEEILGDSKKAAQQKMADKQTEAEVKVEAQLEQERVAQEQEDQQLIEQKLEELRQATNSPQYKARVDQIEEKKQEDEQHQEETAGHEIRQLDHTKI